MCLDDFLETAVNLRALHPTTLRVAAVMALVCGNAHAITDDLGVLSSDVTYFSNYIPNLGGFTDYYTFSLGSNSTVSGATFEIDIGKWLNVDLSRVSVKGGTLASALSDTSPTNGFNFAGLAAGQYVLEVAGVVTGHLGGAYYGAIQAKQSVASPAPEPEAYALMALGLAGVALLVRRARSR